MVYMYAFGWFFPQEQAWWVVLCKRRWRQFTCGQGLENVLHCYNGFDDDNDKYSIDGFFIEYNFYVLGNSRV